MIKITRFTTYTPDLAAACRRLLIDLSRSGKDHGEIPRAWFDEIAASPYHDLLLAVAEDGTIVGMASVSVVMGAGINKTVFLEDFVTSKAVRGQGIGSALWSEIVAWGREHGCEKLEFTSGHGREAAHTFYLNKGAEIYDTNFFRYLLTEEQ